MVTRKRKRQEQRYYTGMQVNCTPVISTRQRVASRQQPDADTVFTLLNAQIRNRLHSKVVKCLKDNSSPATLKANCTSMTQLERGIVSEAETAGNLPTTTITKFLNKHNKAHQTKSIDLWKDYVAKHFDEIIDEEMAKLAAEAEEADNDGAHQDENVGPVTRVPENAIRSCTVSLSAIIRQDIPDELKREFAQRLSRTIVNLYKLTILFKDHTFEVDTNNAVIIQGQRGFQCGAILPDWFLLENTQVFVAPPLQTEALELDGFANQYKKLFNGAYLELVHSNYFRREGVSPVSLASNPLFSAVRNIIPRDEQNMPELDSFVMHITLSQYKISLANM
ncbi:unnamed protein product [Mucor fragilis]